MDLREIRAKQQARGLKALVQQRRTERSNGDGPKPQGLAAIRTARAAQRKAVREDGLSAFRKQRQGARKHSSKLDRTFDGLRYHDIRVIDFGVHPWGRISVTNGDKTFTLHNRYGSWLADLSENRLAEPAAIARALGTNLTQYDMGAILQDRWYAALKLNGLPTPEERVRQREEEARAARRGGRSRKNVDNTEES